MTSNKHCFFPFGWGARPQAHTGLRQFVILTRDPRFKHQGPSCVNLSYIFLIKKMRLFHYVNLTNGGKYGIKIRLHKYRLQQLEQRRSRHSSWFLLDSDGSGDAGRNRKELERNFIPDLLFTKSWTWTMDRGPGTKSYNSMAEKAFICDNINDQDIIIKEFKYYDQASNYIIIILQK